MILTLEYLRDRHTFWIDRIAGAGIWEAERFAPVELSIRPVAKRYHALFRRKCRVAGKRSKISDAIVIYRQGVDTTIPEADSLLVHEMIHQYIAQNSIRDTSPHGKIFRAYMTAINKAFPRELRITVSSAVLRQTGRGPVARPLLIIQRREDEYYLCLLEKSKRDFFMQQARRMKSNGEIIDAWLCESDDRYFDTVGACRTVLHGRRFTAEQLNAFCIRYNIHRNAL